MPMSPAAPRSARANFNEVIRVLRRASAYVRTVKNGLFERFLTSPCIFRHTLKLKNTIFTKVYNKIYHAAQKRATSITGPSGGGRCEARGGCCARRTKVRRARHGAPQRRRCRLSGGLVENLVDDAVFDGLLGIHEEIAVDIFLYLVQSLPYLEDLFRGYLDVRRHTLRPA